MDEALVCCRFVHFAAVLTVFGGAAFRVYGLGNIGCAAALAVYDAWFARLAMAGSIVALLSGVGVLMATAAGMAGSAAAAVDPRLVWQVLRETAFGAAWGWHLASCAALVAVCALRPGPRPRLVAVLALLVAASLAWTGHAAMGTGAAGFAREANQTLHVLAGGLWVGGLVPLAWLLRHARQPSSKQIRWIDVARDVLPRFSRMGYTAVGLILATGCANTALLVGRVQGLVASLYGRVLLIKIVLFAAMILLAVVNRYRLMPRLSEARSDTVAVTLARSVLCEQLLGFAVIGVVSQLGTMMPAINP